MRTRSASVCSREARQAADALSAKRQEALRTDAKNLNRAIQQRTQHEVFSIARKALMDLATTSLEERLTAVFTRRLRELDGPTKAGLAKALEAASGSALVRSAFELPTDQRAVIQNALNETFSAEVHVRFETAPDLVSGIELTASGQKVGWSIDGYLASLEGGIDDLLKEKEQEKAKDDKANDDKAKDDKAKDDKAKDAEGQGRQVQRRQVQGRQVQRRQRQGRQVQTSRAKPRTARPRTTSPRVPRSPLVERPRPR